MDNPICSKAAAENFTLLQLWHRQVKQHHFETFRGVGLEKFPQDLWTYEKVIWDTKPTIIFEIGINKGGFSLWLADRLRSIHMYQKNLSDISGSSNRLPKVVGFDINTTRAQSNVLMHHDLAPYIFIERVDVSDISKLNNTAYGYINEDDIVFVIEDSAHNYQTTSASLSALAPLVSSGSYFVVEDACVDYEHLRESKRWPRGVKRAIDEFLLTNPDFVQDPVNNLYTITCHPGGFLRRVK